jgi:nucleotide-binding universal stress UspA family protein
MKHILVPVDFSTESQHACRVAADLAFKTQAHVVLLHAYDGLLATADGIREQLDAFAETHLSPRVPHLSMAEPGTPVEVIRRMSQLPEMKAVVLGTKGAKGWTGALRGSIAAEVLRSVELPIFIIPQPEQDAPLQRLVLASDMRTDETPVFRAVSALARLYHAEVTLLHVVEDGAIVHAPHPALESLLQGSELGNWGRVEWNAADVETGLHRYIEAHGADLLVLSTTTHSVWEQLFHMSLARKEAARAALPLLVFHRFTGKGMSERGLDLFE